MMGQWQAGGGSVMLLTMFCWKTLGLAIQVDLNLTWCCFGSMQRNIILGSWSMFRLMYAFYITAITTVNITGTLHILIVLSYIILILHIHVLLLWWYCKTIMPIKVP